MSYGNITWGNTRNQKRLQPIRKLQMKIIRIMTFSKFTDHQSPLFKELSILPLDDINNFLTLNKDIHKNITRSSSNVHSIQARTNY